MNLALLYSLAFLDTQKTGHFGRLIAVVRTLQVLSVAAAIRRRIYENFTDVDSVFAANPTL